MEKKKKLMTFDPVTNYITKCNHHIKNILAPFASGKCLCVKITLFTNHLHTLFMSSSKHDYTVIIIFVNHLYK